MARPAILLCLNSVLDQHRFDAGLDLDPIFHFDAYPDPDPTDKNMPIFFLCNKVGSCLESIDWLQMRSWIRQIIRILFHNPVSYNSHVSQRLCIAHSHLYPDLACHSAKLKGTVAWDSDGF
jgi:hypothetical protein